MSPHPVGATVDHQCGAEIVSQLEWLLLYQDSTFDHKMKPKVSVHISRVIALLRKWESQLAVRTKTCVKWRPEVITCGHLEVGHTHGSRIHLPSLDLEARACRTYLKIEKGMESMPQLKGRATAIFVCIGIFPIPIIKTITTQSETLVSYWTRTCPNWIRPGTWKRGWLSMLLVLVLVLRVPSLMRTSWNLQSCWYPYPI